MIFGAVRVYRFFAKAQHIGDLLVRMALRYKFQDFRFTGGKSRT